MTETDAWGQLVSLTDFESEPLALIGDSFTIGRAKDCDLPFPANKLVSNRHCSVQQDGEGKVWLCDSSTNGTLLNLKSKITKGNKKELQHGDEFYVVYKKGEEEKNIGFVYQSMAELAKEDSSEMEQTQEYDTEANIMDATLIDSDINVLDETHEEEDCGKKRSKGDDSKDSKEPKAKIAKLSDDVKQTKDKSEDKAVEPSGDNKVKSKEEISQEEQSKLKSAGGTKPTAVPAVDEIEETLLCSICQELLYNCISLQPCMHSYCAGCYSDWMKKSNECPTCRMKVKRINKNHIVNNLIEAYLKEHPEKKRPEEDLKELDAKNKITKEMMTPIATEGYDNDEDVTDDEDYNDSDENENFRNNINPPPAVVPPAAPPAPLLFGFGTPFFGNQQARTKCRQCPGYIPPNAPTQPGIIQTAINAVGTALGLKQADEANTEKGEGDTKEGNSDGDSQDTQSLGENPGPSTSGGRTVDPELKDEKIMPNPRDYVCAPWQNHVLCQCCLQPMPDLRANPEDNHPQQCAICYRNFCHAYWGCTKADCQGCLGKFKDLNFGKKCLNTLILENIYESEIFKNYVEAKGITVKQVLRDSLKKLDAGKYSCPDQSRFRIDSNTALCYTCGMRNFKELAYQYRMDIPKEDFPEDVQKRENCYWGKNCRTQRTRPHHAKNFSHVCDQIRTT